MSLVAFLRQIATPKESVFTDIPKDWHDLLNEYVEHAALTEAWSDSPLYLAADPQSQLLTLKELSEKSSAQHVSDQVLEDTDIRFVISSTQMEALQAMILDDNISFTSLLVALLMPSLAHEYHKVSEESRFIGVSVLVNLRPRLHFPSGDAEADALRKREVENLPQDIRTITLMMPSKECLVSEDQPRESLPTLARKVTLQLKKRMERDEAHRSD